MKAQEAVVAILAETGVVAGEAAKPFIHKETGAVLMKHRVQPIVHSRRSTGVIIDKIGIIVTNAHTVNQAGRVTVTTQAGKSHRAEVIAIASALDLALLKITGDTPFSALQLANSDTTKLNDRVYSIGGSNLIKNTLSEGKVSGIGIKKKGHGQRAFLRVTFNIYAGDSGSPILSRDGQLLGIMAGAARRKNKVAYAIPSNAIVALLKQQNLNST